MPARPVPTPRQLEFQNWEFGIFLHFGIRTFYEGRQDWDGKPMSPESFNPTALDCGQWADVARRAGARYMVLTAKHHDGFANWPSRCTDFSVASSPWKDGRGDVVREFTDACRAQELKIGLYYSPADWKCPVYADPKAYDDFFIRQIAEILTGYGRIDMLWFDGCGSENHTYDWARILPEIRRMQPDLLLFNMGDPDYRWVGNEAGLAPDPCWNTVETGGSGEGRWLPAECDCRIRDRNWFFQDADAHTVKSPAELMGLYDWSVGRGANLLLNVGPDRRGRLPDRDADHLLAFGRDLQRRFGAPFAETDAFAREGDSWTCRFETARLLDHVVAQEDLTGGESVRRFRITVAAHPHGPEYTAWEGSNMGHKRICQFPLVRTRQVRITVLEADGPVAVRRLALHNTSGEAAAE